MDSRVWAEADSLFSQPPSMLTVAEIERAFELGSLLMRAYQGELSRRIRLSSLLESVYQILDGTLATEDGNI